jgi:protein-tyrosine phosphatase
MVLGIETSKANPISVLVVCTANICRSPMLGGFLLRDLAALGIDAEVSSAGIMSTGEPPATEAVHVLSRRGIDISAHRSRMINREMLAGADLVLGMTREHVRIAAVECPATYRHAFTVRELVRRGVEWGPPVHEPLGVWLARISEGRTVHDHMGMSAADDVADPYGQSMAAFERTAEELAQLSMPIAAFLSRVEVVAPAG